MKYELNQMVKITNPWSGSDFKKGDLAVVHGIFQHDAEDGIMYTLKALEDDRIFTLYPSEFDAISVGDYIRSLDNERLAYFIAGLVDMDFDSKKIEKLCNIFSSPFTDNLEISLEVDNDSN